MNASSCARRAVPRDRSTAIPVHPLTSAAFSCAAALGLLACAAGADPGGAGAPEPAPAAVPEIAASLDALDTGARARAEDAPRAGKKGSPSSAALPPLVSPELDASALVYGPAPQAQHYPAAASAGGTTLVAWEDARNTGFDAASIYAARVAEDGALLDPGGIQITGLGFSPGVATDGENFLVVWHEDGIHGARVSPAGQLLDPAGFLIAPYGWMPRVAFDGASYVVAWAEFYEGSGVRAARVSPGGAVLDPDGIPVTPALTYQLGVAAGGGGSLITWNQDGDVLAARLDASGAVLDPGGFPVAAGAAAVESPAAAFDGARYTVAWQRWESWQSTGVAAARVSPAGAVLDPAGITLSTGPITGFTGVAAVFDGASTVVAWNEWAAADAAQVRAARVSPEGAALDPGGVVLDKRAGDVALARGGAGTLAFFAYEPDPDGWADVYGARIGADLARLDGEDRLISSAVARQIEPAITFDGQRYVAVWADERRSTRGLYAARITPWGEILDPDGILVADGTSWDTRPVAHFDGTNTVIVWQTVDVEGGDGWLYAARLSPGGEVLGPFPEPLGYGVSGTRYTAASDSAGTWIVIDHGVVDWDGNELRAIRLGAGGQPPVITALPIEMPGLLRMPTLHHDGAGYLLTWLTAGDGPTQGLHGARMTDDGELLDPAGFPISDLAAGGDVLAPAAIVKLGENRLVVWKEDRGGAISLYGAEVSPDGAVLSSQSIPLGGTLNQWDPHEWIRVGFDVADEGDHALVVWRDVQDPADPSLLGARVAPGGAVEPAFTISAQPGPEGEPRVASQGAGRSLVAFHRPAEGGVSQVKARFVTSPGCSVSAGEGGAGSSAAPLALAALGAALTRRCRARAAASPRR